MASPQKKTATEKRLDTLADSTEKQKKSLVAQLRRTPIVQLACERTDVGRSTYYKWRARDKVFARAADRALDAGRFFINDLAESKLIRMIQDGNLQAIKFWLTHNNRRYAVTTRFIHEHEVPTNRPSVEEQNVAADVMSKMLSHKLAKRIEKNFSVDDTREQIEEEFEAAERNAPDRKRMEAFEEDSEER